MNFYTSVELIRNKICYRGYNDNGVQTQHKYDFRPTLFRPSPEDVGWKSMGGKNVAPFTLQSPSEMYDWTKSHADIDGFEYYGSDKAVMQFIQQKFPNTIKFNSSWINTVAIDIEVNAVNGQSWKPENPEAEVTAICCKSSKSNTYYVWGLKPYDVSERRHKHLTVIYRQCANEFELLGRWLDWWCSDYPDVVTGWYIRMFDIPYLVNRISRIAGEDISQKLSPWNKIKKKSIKMSSGKFLETFDILGVATMDGIEIFKKFGHTYGPQETYTLDHIAHTVLGERKLSYEEHGSLRKLYEQNHQLYIDYNIKDVELVERINNESGLLDLSFMVAYMAGSTFGDVFGTTAMWDSIVYRESMRNNVAIPSGRDASAMFDKFDGGYVKTVKPGMYEWVVSFDLASLYPNIIAQWNMSRETLRTPTNVSQASNPDYYLNNMPEETDYTVAGNGTMYEKGAQGTFPRIIVDYYAQRKEIKNEALRLESDYQKSPDPKLKQKIDQLNNKQMAIKILLNSMFGAIGNKWFRYFDLRIAEGITRTGQLVIKSCEKLINDELNKLLETDTDYVIAMDTDSLYVNFAPLVQKFQPKNPLEFLDKIGKDHFNGVFEKGMKELHEKMNSFELRMEMEREVIADKALFRAKKNYILNMLDKEGVRYEPSKLKIMGIEAIKSSTPMKVRDMMRGLFPILMSGTEDDTQKYIAKCKAEFMALPLEQIAQPRSANNVSEYDAGEGVVKSRCPIAVRGVISHNWIIEREKLGSELEVIANGEKVKLLHLRLPNHSMQNIIGFTEFLPKQFKLDDHVDKEKQWNKAFVEPVKSLLDIMQWSDKPAESLLSFME